MISPVLLHSDRLSECWLVVVSQEAQAATITKVEHGAKAIADVCLKLENVHNVQVLASADARKLFAEFGCVYGFAYLLHQDTEVIHFTEPSLLYCRCRVLCNQKHFARTLHQDSMQCVNLALCLADLGSKLELPASQQRRGPTY